MQHQRFQRFDCLTEWVDFFYGKSVVTLIPSQRD